MKGVEQWNQSGVDNEEGIDNASGPVEDVETRKVCCTVWSRVVGYYSPVNLWNVGKTQEWKERKTYDVNKSLNK